MPDLLDVAIIDAHEHLDSAGGIDHLAVKSKSLGYHKINLVTIAIDAAGYPRNASALLMKAGFPETVYVCGGLQYHWPGLSAGRANILQQAQELMLAGCDGIKMVEAKPSVRRQLQIPLDHPTYTDFYAFMQEQGYPIVCHVADLAAANDVDDLESAEQSPELAGGAAGEASESLREEMLEVLRRFPQLKVVLAHFFFLAGDIDSAERVIREFDHVFLDLAPAPELYSLFSRDPAGWREFFIRHQDRILYGSGLSDLDSQNDFTRMELIRRFLETSETFSFGSSEIRGLHLPRETLDDIYRMNFQRLFGSEPRPLNLDLSAAHCDRMAGLAVHIEDDDIRQRVLAELAKIARKFQAMRMEVK